jgi:hypothetical protein
MAGWIGLGLGGAALVVGGVTAGLAAGKASDLKQVCQDGQCPSSQGGTISSYNGLADASTISFVAGGVLAAGGLALVLFGPRDTRSSTSAARVVPLVGPGHFGARVTF